MNDGIINGFDPGSANQFGVELGLEPRENGVIALTLNGGDFKNAEALITPQQAKDMGEILVRLGLKALTGVETEQGVVIKDIIRNKLGNRAKLVMANLRERKYSDEYIGQEIVDIVLRELL